MTRPGHRGCERGGEEENKRGKKKKSLTNKRNCWHTFADRATRRQRRPNNDINIANGQERRPATTRKYWKQRTGVRNGWSPWRCSRCSLLVSHLPHTRHRACRRRGCLTGGLARWQGVTGVAGELFCLNFVTSELTLCTALQVG